MVEDPPYIQREVEEARHSLKVDYVGLALVALGLGALQVVLDKGQEDDWFNSHLIVALSIVAVAGLVAFALWEWNSDEPIVDLHLLKRRTFASTNIMMFLLGAVLFGSTVLIPQFLQEVMNYSAQQAGMVLSPGGLAIMVMMPLVGFLVSRIDGRWLIGVGFIITALAMFHMTTLDARIDFHTAVMYRIYQSAGLAFLFIPINTMAYVGIPQEKNREVSGMLNLCRNIGGSVGISLITTMLARRAQFHQDHLASNVTPYTHSFRALRAGLSRGLLHAGLSGAQATKQAVGRVYAMVQGQATVLAYIDVIWLLAILCVAMLPLILLMKRNDPRLAPAGVH